MCIILKSGRNLIKNLYVLIGRNNRLKKVSQYPLRNFQHYRGTRLIENTAGTLREVPNERYYSILMAYLKKLSRDDVNYVRKKVVNVDRRRLYKQKSNIITYTRIIINNLYNRLEEVAAIESGSI